MEWRESQRKEVVHLWEWRDATIHCGEWPESPFNQHTQCLYTTKALVLVVSFYPLENAVAFPITHGLIFNVEKGQKQPVEKQRDDVFVEFQNLMGVGEKGGNTIRPNPKGQIGTPKGKRATYFVQLLRPGGKGVTDGVTDRVMGSLKAKLFEREVL